MAKNQREVKIKAKAAAYAPLEDFVWFQGELKSLSDENYGKLKKQILELGFSEPVSVWIDENELKLLNGHQRILTLKKMQDEGYRIPHIPYSVIEADNEDQAKRKVLSLTSQFGEITQEGLLSFIEDTTITRDQLSFFALPDIDLDALPEIDIDKHTSIKIDVREHTRELSQEDFENFDHKCPKCGFEFDEKS